jgi:hypothetical protein
MENVLRYAILLSPALLVPALLAQRWSLRRTLAYLGLATVLRPGRRAAAAGDRLRGIGLVATAVEFVP